MNDDLKTIIRKAQDELKQTSVTDIVIKRSLIEFARSYNSVSADEQRICYDTAAAEFLEEIFGRNSHLFQIYWRDYVAAKAGELSIEQLPKSY